MPPPTRRAILAAPVLIAARGIGFDDWDALARATLAPIRGAAVAAAAGDRAPALLRSWAVQDTAADFDRVNQEAAYTYDNALAGLALLAAGERTLAARIGEALRIAQAQDRYWCDGRLRNAYAAVGVAPRQHDAAPATTRPPGWWDARARRWLEDGYHAGSAAGPVAFAMLLWLALGDPDSRAAAERAADWVEAALHDPDGGYRGGFLGHEPTPMPLLWRSTEQNLDLAVAFARLGREAAAAHARRFVRRMWSVSERRFLSGLTPEGTAIAHSAVDANLWPLLAWPLETRFAPALEWVLSRHGLPAGAARAEVTGVDFDTDRDGVWLEGTAQAVLLLRVRGEEALAERLAATLARHRAIEGWVLASSVPWLTTGLATGLAPADAAGADFRYPRRGHLGATAWAALAALGANPFGPGLG
jgi:hypothetical protein